MERDDQKYLPLPSFIQFYRLNIEALLRAPEVPADYSLGGLFSISLPQKEKQKMLLNLWLSRKGSTEEFWKSLNKHPDFSNNDFAEEIMFVLQLNLLTFSHLPLMKVLRQRGNKKRFKKLADLRQLDIRDWIKILESKFQGQDVGYPSFIHGRNDNETKINYALNIYKLLENVFPESGRAATSE